MNDIAQSFGYFFAASYKAIHALTGSHGISIIIFSVAVSLILLPISSITEGRKRVEKRQKDAMAPEIKKIKKSYSGRERFCYIRMVYRRYGYHPLNSLYVLVGLLIQIAFFLAAYRFFVTYQALEGENFTFIRNLAQPDGIVSENIHILPFVMLAVNIASILLYAMYESRRETMQQCFVAMLFFILLYHMPAGLLVYWITNNLVSLIKNIYVHTQRSAFHRMCRGEDAKAAKIACYRIGHATKWLAGSTALFSAYMMSVYLLYGDTSAPAALVALYHSIVTLIVLCGIAVIACTKRCWTSGNTAAKITWLAHVCTALFVACASALIATYTIADPKECITIGLIVFAVLVLPWFVRMASTKPKNALAYAGDTPLFLLSFLCICILLFLYLPILVYASSPDELSTPLHKILVANVPYIVGVLIAGTAFYVWTPHSMKTKFSFTCMYIACLFIVFAFLVPLRIGPLMQFTLVDADLLQGEFFQYLLDFIVIATVLVIALFVYRYYKKQAVFVFLSINIAMAGHGYYAASPMPNAADIQNTQEWPVLPHNNDAILGFSREGKNIVVFMLDMFTGGYVQTIFEEVPRLQSIYDGFVWYPNTLAVANLTNASIPAMLGGPAFAPGSTNADTSRILLTDTIVHSYDFMIDTMQNAGYSSAFVNPSFYYHGFAGDCRKMIQKNVLCAQSHQYSAYWQNIQMMNNPSSTNGAEGKLLTMVALFKAMPFVYKNYIYDEGDWLIVKKTEIMQNAFRHAVNHWGFLDLMPDISNADAQGNTFKYIQNKVTHLPYAMSEECVPLQDRYPDPSSGDNTRNKNPYYSAKCAMVAIADFLSWLQENGIYDNTKIILVSDHGNAASVSVMQPKGGGELGSIFGMAHALLLVKDFGSRGSLTRDDRFLSNADTPAIICSALGGCEGIEKDPTQGLPAENRILTITRVGGWSWEYLQGLYEHMIEWQYEVRDDMFDYQNWKRVK